MSSVENARSERVALRLTPELKALVDQFAAEDDVSLSKWMERVVKEAAQKRRKAN